MSGSSSRGEFTSSFGFVMAAAGSAIGLGNIWGFPTQTAENGGAAFVFLYLILAFFVGYPVLLAEFTIGRHTRSNPVGVYQKIKGGKRLVFLGFVSLLGIGAILSFYAIIAGSMLAYFIEPFMILLGMDDVATWITAKNDYSRALFASLFVLLTIFVVLAGVKNGIEKYSTRLMPTLLVLMVLLIGYVFTLDGAMDGLKKYLLPDFNKVFTPKLFISAMGQAFFSLSLGVGSMIVYASYTSKKENLFRLGTLVTLCDVGVAFLAGLLIIPSMYVAANLGTPIVNVAGELVAGPDLIFRILPSLFDTMGTTGLFVAMVFFFLMSIASLTSTISMLEVPVAYAVDNRDMNRTRASVFIGMICWAFSMLIVFFYDDLFEIVVIITTQYIQPLMGMATCIFVGWVVHRHKLLQELKQGNPQIEHSFLMKIWPFFLKVVSPTLILLVFIQQFMG